MSRFIVVVAVAFLAVAFAAPAPAGIVYDAVNDDKGRDGLIDIDTVSKGSYSWVNPDGVTIYVNWAEDENGFQATGDHLPTPPPMPERVVDLHAVL